MTQEVPSATSRKPEILVLEDRSADERGESYPVSASFLEFLGAPRDLHVASVGPGFTRGNHYHAERCELILVIHRDRWSLHWDGGPGTEARHRDFEGAGVVAIKVPPHAAHAITNDGEEPLWLFAATDGPYDPDAPDAYGRVVTPG